MADNGKAVPITLMEDLLQLSLAIEHLKELRDRPLPVLSIEHKLNTIVDQLIVAVTVLARALRRNDL